MMRLPLPRSLFWRLMLIWCIGIALILALGTMLFVDERGRLGRSMLVDAVAQDLAVAVGVLEYSSQEHRPHWTREFSRRRLRLQLGPAEGPLAALDASHPLTEALRTALPEYPELQVFHLPGRRDPRPGALVTLQLRDGTPLTARLAIATEQRPPPPPHAGLLGPLSLFVGGVLLLTALAVRLALRPLSHLTAAARALERDPQCPPLDTGGPRELALAAQAFNGMQARIRADLAERTRILGAISHDLQTPITRLRLRAELMEDDSLRDRVVADLDTMQELVREGLDFARSMDVQEAEQSVRLDELLQTLADDAADMGWEVRLAPLPAAHFRGRIVGLQRALWNLIGNGVKFGGSVQLSLEELPGAWAIHIRDHGPGLPDEELEKVFEPFYRAEQSRSRDSGGTGLGLAIARNLLRAQGGEVSLSAPPDGGLLASVRLPRPGGENPQLSPGSGTPADN